MPETVLIYGARTTTFEGLGNGTLMPSSCVVSEQLNGSYELKMTHPYDIYGKWRRLDDQKIIYASTPKGYQPFRIYSIKPATDEITVNARHIFYDLLDDLCMSVSYTGAAQGALNAIKSGMAYPMPFTFTTNLTGSGSISVRRVSPITALLGDDDDMTSFAQAFGGEIDRDGWSVVLKASLGQDRGDRVAYAKNLIGLEVTEDASSVITRVYPIGKDGLTAGYVDSTHINDYPNPKIYVLEDVSLETTGELQAAAKVLLDGGADLPQINIFDEHAVVVEGYGEFTGMNRDECREAVIKWFDEHGLLDHVDEHDHSVMHCYRCDSALEPWLSEQWFVAVDKLKGPALDAVNSGKVTFHPARWTQTYTTWMENLKDWCISRQLWWGHRIPVFYCEDCGWEDALTEDTDVCPKCGGHHVHQDENVLDTWFSSQLWTFATQGWPQKPELLEGHHPTTALVTARDIIALWVARMVMSSLYFLDEVPFKDVVIYPTILAKDGSRMSKSKGNGVDPMDLIGMYGADAMRYNLLTLCTNNQDVKFDANIDKKTKKLIDSPRTDQAKSFVTKIWNASRFLLMNMEGYAPGEPVVETPADAWMFSRLAKAVKMVTEGIENYTFGDMARGVQQFFWNEVCDWYVEVTKARLKGEGRLQAQRNLIFVLDTSIRLMHPLMPFVTEEIWDNMPASVLDLDAEGNVDRAEALMIAKWPEPADYAKYVDEPAERAFELCRTVVSAARATRSRYRLSPKAELDVVVRAGAEDIEKLESLRSTIEPLANTTSLVMGTDVEKPAASIAVVDSGVEVFVVLEGKVDLSAEKARLEKEIAAAQKELAGCEKTLANEGFVAKAAPAVIQKKRDRAAELKEILAALTAQVADFS